QRQWRSFWSSCCHFCPLPPHFTAFRPSRPKVPTTASRFQCSIPPSSTHAPIANSALTSPMPLPRIVVVPPPFAEIAELARTLAPSGFELVIVRNEHTELEAALATAEYLVCYPNVRTGDAFYR